MRHISASHNLPYLYLFSVVTLVRWLGEYVVAARIRRKCSIGGRSQLLSASTQAAFLVDASICMEHALTPCTAFVVGRID